VSIDWKGWIIWSNHFYGICAAMLCIESSYMLLHQFPNYFLLALVYLATVIYYTHAYITESTEGISNERMLWYQQHKKYLVIRQLVFTCICLYIALFKIHFLQIINQASIAVYIILFFTIISALGYYIPNVGSSFIRSYRTKGLLKSMAIAWVWTITCCLMPILMEPNATIYLMHANFILFAIQLFIYVFLLAILFDIKDIQKDQNEQVNTIALKLGAEKTVSAVIVPLLLLYFLVSTYWVYKTAQSPLFLLFQAFLVLLTYYMALKIIQQRTIFINVLLIDGLLILKAVLSGLYLLIIK
jgi:hypothetical protein